jgi:SAM-dependent methyltransferase
MGSPLDWFGARICARPPGRHRRRHIGCTSDGNAMTDRSPALELTAPSVAEPRREGGLLALLNTSRQRTLDRWPSADAFVNIFYSGTTYALWRAAEPLTRGWCRGLTLDAGSGRGAWSNTIAAAGAIRESVDIAPKADEQVTWIADLTDMPQVPSNRYDSIVCHQVLEHVPSPASAAAEMHRTLKPSGVLILSVPHLSRQHELPHDYFRFTPGGVAKMLCDAGFEIERLEVYGGLLTFVHHQLSAVVLGLAAVTGPTYVAATALNAPFCWLTNALDRLLDQRGLLANGVIAVARKRAP